MTGRGLICAAVFLAFPAFADDASLSDLRAELGVLRNDLQSLRTELVSTGPQSYQQAGGDSALDRMNVMEHRIERLTNQTEKLENRVRRIVEDGTRRINDIEFRLCEMEEHCDLGALTTPQLGSQAVIGAAPYISAAPGLPTKGDAATADEQVDFDAALSALNQGEYMRAAEMFGAVAQKHAGGPLTAEALYMRGMALEKVGQPKEAAVAWLEGFTVNPNGPRAAQSLSGIARTIALQGDPVASCLYLAEIPVRFPGVPQAAEAESQMLALNCGANLPGETDQGFLSDEVETEFAADLAPQ